jgi:hypothetical protein
MRPISVSGNPIAAFQSQYHEETLQIRTLGTPEDVLALGLTGSAIAGGLGAYNSAGCAVAYKMGWNVVSAQGVRATSVAMAARMGFAVGAVAGFKLFLWSAATALALEGIEHAPRLFSDKKTSDYITDGLQAMFGSPFRETLDRWDYWTQGGPLKVLLE